MNLKLLPKSILDLYEVKEWKHACAILKTDFPAEWNDIIEVLDGFRLRRSAVAAAGGSKSEISKSIDAALYKRGWIEKQFKTQLIVDGVVVDSPTHKIDCYKNRVALEIEWNNKEPFFDRDLNNFRLLFDLRTISVGVIVTRSDELKDVFRDLGREKSFGESTTHMGKLAPKIQGGGGGGCPLLVFGIGKRLYLENE